MAPRLLLGNLNNGANAGRRYANLNNALSNANWNYGARISDQCVLCFNPLEGSSKELGPICPKLTNQHQAMEETSAPGLMTVVWHEWGLVAHPNVLEFRKKVTMKTYCKNVDISDKEFIYNAIWNYMHDKKGNNQLTTFFANWTGKRYSDVRFLLKCACNQEYISNLKRSGTSEEDAKKLFDYGQSFFVGVMREISEEMSIHLKGRTVKEHIQARRYDEQVVRYLEITDTGSGKKRDLGLECFLFRLYETVANAAADPLFDAKVGEFQVASIKGKGQKYGKKAVKKWLSQDPDGTKIGCKADVQKCYPSIDHAKLRSMLHRDIRKADLLVYLFDTIIDLYEEYPNPSAEDATKGILIGSPVSKDLCNYYMSRLYHYACEQLFKVKTRRGKEQKTRLISHIMIYMDDIQIYGSNKKDVQTAMILLVKFARDELGLTIKPNWRKFRTMYKDAAGRVHGCLLDFMGFRFHGGETIQRTYYGRTVKYREVWITVRDRTFIKARRKFARFERMVKRNQNVSYRFAKSLTSYFGCFKQTDSAAFRKDNKIDQLMRIARKIVSHYAKGKPYEVTKYKKMWRCKCA